MHATKPSIRQLTLAGACLSMTGCIGNPFAPMDDDYGQRLPVQRVRDVGTLDIDSFVSAEQPDLETGEMNLAKPPSQFDGLAELELSIEEARAATLANNLDLQVALVDPAIQEQSVSEEEAAFNSAFTLRALMVQTDTPTSSSLNDAQAEQQLVTPGVRIPLLTGGTANVTLPMTRNETNNSFSTLNPAYTSDLRFSLSQPLLRGAGRRSTTHALRIASINYDISQARTKATLIAQLATAERAYWLLYAAREELALRQEEFEVAQEVLEQAQRLLDAGSVAEIELIRAQSGVADRLDAILRAEQAVLIQQRSIKRVMNIEGLGVDSETVILPTSPPDPVLYELNPDELAELAIASRMDLLEVELQLLADASTIDFNRNQTLPTLNFDASYTINGLGGNLDDSFDTTIDNNFEDWSLGLTGEVPIGNQAAESRLRRSVLTRIQRLASKAGREQTIRQDVFDAADRIRADWQRILAARQAVILNTRTLSAERRQFELGGSTSTDVLDAATRLVSARSDEIRAVVDYQIAQLNLAESTGMVLGASKVRWEPYDSESEEVRALESGRLW
ncbi:MAG: TolC family protein [Phycisphaera sp.]|nr:MAG: TolC family protein [Phycisphaera sp.]